MTKDEAIEVLREAVAFELSALGEPQAYEARLSALENALKATATTEAPTSEAVAEKPQDDRNAASPAALVGCGYESVMGFVAAHLSAQPAADPAPVPFIAWEVARHDTGAVEDLNAAEIRETWRSDHAKLDERAAFEAYMGKHGWFPHLFATSQDGSYQAREIHNLWSVWKARGQQAGMPEDVRDAARYRFMRDEATGNFLRFCPYGKPSEIDSAIDSAIAAAAAPGEAG